MLYNRSHLGWLPIFSLSTLLKLNFFLLDLNNNSLKYTTALSLQPTPLATLVLFFTSFFKSSDLTFSDQITALSKSCYYQIHELCCIRPYLDFKTASTIATSIVHSKLDYCNSLYRNLPNCQLNWLQQIQNSLARAVVKAPKSTHITPILKSLHRLKVNQHIEYRSTRSSSVVTLSRPPTISSLKITDRSFRYASPRLWNQLNSRLIPSASPFLSWFTSSSTSQLISDIIHTLVIHHSFTLSLQAQNLPFQQILLALDFFYLLDSLTITGLDRTYHVHHFIFSFSYLIFCLFRVVD